MLRFGCYLSIRSSVRYMIACLFTKILHLQMSEEQQPRQQQSNEPQPLPAVIECAVVCDGSELDMQIFPPGRYSHISAFYKGRIYISGGVGIDADSQPSPYCLYFYCLQRKQWNRVLTKASHPNFELFRPQCGALIASRWYLLGDSTMGGGTQLWRLNFQSLQWGKVQQRGQIPPNPQGGCLSIFEKNWLVFYGVGEYGNSFYLHGIDSKLWHICEGNYNFFLKSRINSSMCTLNGGLYLFGGAYQGEDKIQYLNDFYALSLTLPIKGIVAKADIIKIPSSEPEARACHVILPVGNYICLIGGQSSENINKNVWFFNLATQKWISSGDLGFQVLERLGYSLVSSGSDLYLFGGLQNDEASSVMGDLWKFTINWQSLAAATETQCYERECSLCYEHRRGYIPQQSKFNGNVMNEISSIIEYPYSAFGLLIDNSIILGANIINIHVEGTGSNAVIRIEDNGKESWNDEDMVRNFSYYESQNNVILIGTDKKIKRSIVKDNVRREFGVNLKIGAFRLAKRFLYVSLVGETVRVALCSQKGTEPKHWHVLHFYAYNINTKILLDPEQAFCRTIIQAEYFTYIRQALSRRKITNTLFLFDTFINEDLVNIRSEISDIWLGEATQIEKMEKDGYCLGDCVDVSLRAYLSMLFLRNDTLNMSLAVCSQSSPIFIQNVLEKVDRICKSGLAIELEGIVDFDFKIAEFYFLRDQRRNQQFFSNGVLLYSRNRLIGRYRPPLGTLLANLHSQATNLLNYLPLFGSAELPESIPVNATKTDFMFPMMVEKLFNRIKFVEQSLRNRSKTWAPVIKRGRTDALDNRKRPLTEASPPPKVSQRLQPSLQMQERKSSQIERNPPSEVVLVEQDPDYRSDQSLGARGVSISPRIENDLQNLNPISSSSQ